MFELAVEQGALWWTEQRALVTTATKTQRWWDRVTRGQIGNDRVRKYKVRKRQNGHEARISTHSISLVVITVVTTHVKWSKNNSTLPSACCRGDTWVTVTVVTAPCLPYTPCVSPFELCVIKKRKKAPKKPRWHGPASFQELLNRCVFYKSCMMPEVNNTCMSELPLNVSSLHVWCWGWMNKL